MMKMCSAEWKALLPNHRTYWETLAGEDKARYSRELAAWEAKGRGVCVCVCVCVCVYVS